MNTITLFLILGILVLTMYSMVQIDKLKKKISYLEGEKIPSIISLSPIPQRKNLVDVDPNFQTIRDIIESAKLEEWAYKIENDRSGLSVLGPSYTVSLINPSGNLHINSRLRLNKKSDKHEFEPYLGFLSIRTDDGGYLTYDNDSRVRNELILFIWDFIVKFHHDENQEILSSYKNSINLINKKLITINRDRKLNKII